MHYLGGKARIADRLVPILNAVRTTPDQPYLEPFMGACHVLIRMYGPRTASDIHQDLTMLWTAIRDGTYDPPTFVTEEEYLALRDAPPSAHRGFVGFACAFGGTWFGGFARAAKQTNADTEHRVWREDQYVMQARRSVLALRPYLKGVDIRHCSYDAHNPHDSLVYCDPPYFQTSKYKGTSNFDHGHFWDVMREWSNDNTVLVSEYYAPPDFDPVWAVRTKTSMRVKDPNIAIGRHDPRVEKLFLYTGSPLYRRVKSIIQDGALLLTPVNS